MQNILCKSNTKSVGSISFLIFHILPNKKLLLGFIIPCSNAIIIGRKTKVIKSNLVKINQITPRIFIDSYYTINLQANIVK